MATPKRPVTGVLRLILDNQLTLLAAASCMQNIPDGLDRSVAESMMKTREALDSGLRQPPAPQRNKPPRPKYAPFGGDVG